MNTLLTQSSSLQLRDMAMKAVMDAIAAQLFHIHTPDSGRLLESVFQILPDDTFRMLAYLVVGNEFNEDVRNMMYEIVFRIANKLGLEFTEMEPINDAVSVALVILNCENLRRKGIVDYLAPDNIFTTEPKHPGFNKLTETGQQLAYTEALESLSSTPIRFM